mmetsp:Transcript_10097/g.22715  ORF Transcript_10097/g.22715 Transcript_10097/m.22715 type:complete len:164 (+) Transcript_10097:99-590(+)
MSFPAQRSSLGGVCLVDMSPPKCHSKVAADWRPLFQRHPGNHLQHNRMLQTKLQIARQTVSERREKFPPPPRTIEMDSTLDSGMSTLTRCHSAPSVFQPPHTQAISAHMPGYMGFVPGHTSKSETVGVGRSYGLATASANDLFATTRALRTTTAGQFPIRRYY